MSNPNNDTQPAPVTEAEQLQELRKLMITRMLEQAADPGIKASGLAVIAKFLEQAGVIAPRLPPKPFPADRLPFGPDDRPAGGSKFPFPADTDEPRSFKPLDNQPFIVS